MADIRLLELRSTYKWGGGPDKTILLSAERHDPERISVVVSYLRDVHDREFSIAEKARARKLTFYEVPERSKFDLRAVGMIRNLVLRISPCFPRRMRGLFLVLREHYIDASI